MTGYVSIDPKRVHRLAAALRSAAKGADDIDVAYRRLLMEASANDAPVLLSQRPRRTGPLVDVATRADEAARSYERRVDHFERMRRDHRNGIDVGDPQSWFDDPQHVDRAKVEEALEQARALSLMELFDDDARKKMIKTLRGLSAAEMDAFFKGLSDDEAAQLLRQLGHLPLPSWMGVDLPDRGFLNLVGSRISQGTFRRLCNLDPTFRDYFRPSVEGTGFADARWRHTSGVLFAGGPNMDDVDQQKVGDCGFQATLAAIAQKNPGFLKKMIQPNPNGSYTVTFKNKDGGPVRIVVQPETLVNPDGSPITGFGDSPDDPNRDELWAVVLEKAAAQWRGGYKDIQGRWPADWMEEITGQPADRIEASDVGSVSDIQRLLDEGKSVTLSTQSPKDHPGMADVKPKPLFGPHAYTVVKVEDGKVYLQNPWGSGEGLTVVDIQEINAYGTRVEAVDVP